MFTSIRYILICALRDKLFIGLIAGVLIAAFISSMLGGTAFLEEHEMALSYAGASARLMLIVGLITFCCFHVKSALDTREIDVMLSRPISRPKLVIAYWLGFAAVSLLLVAPTALVVCAIGPQSYTGFAAWATSLLLETWFVVAMALFASLALKSAVSSVMACLGFYVLSRMMAFFTMDADSLYNTANSPLIMVSKYALKAISAILPRLDFFAKTEWLVYGVSSAGQWRLFLLQTLIYVPLLLAAAVIDFNRKEF